MSAVAQGTLDFVAGVVNVAVFVFAYWVVHKVWGVPRDVALVAAAVMALSEWRPR